jgi:hypothetical protein
MIRVNESLAAKTETTPNEFQASHLDAHILRVVTTRLVESFNESTRPVESFNESTRLVEAFNESTRLIKNSWTR